MSHSQVKTSEEEGFSQSGFQGRSPLGLVQQGAFRSYSTTFFSPSSGQCVSQRGPRPAASAAPRNWLDMQILRPHSRHTESETGGVSVA